MAYIVCASQEAKKYARVNPAKGQEKGAECGINLQLRLKPAPLPFVGAQPVALCALLALVGMVLGATAQPPTPGKPLLVSGCRNAVRRVGKELGLRNHGIGTLVIGKASLARSSDVVRSLRR